MNTTSRSCGCGQEAGRERSAQKRKDSIAADRYRNSLKSSYIYMNEDFSHERSVQEVEAYVERTPSNGHGPRRPKRMINIL